MCLALPNRAGIQKQLAPFSTEATLDSDQMIREMAERLGKDPDEYRNPTPWHRSPTKIRKSRYFDV